MLNDLNKDRKIAMTRNLGLAYVPTKTDDNFEVCYNKLLSKLK